MSPEDQVIKLVDGTELIPLGEEEKASLEAELSAVLTKYNAIYLPVIKEEKTLTKISQIATLFLLKRKEQGVKSPYKENGESNNKKETPEAN